MNGLFSEVEEGHENQHHFGVCAAHSGIIMWMKVTAGIGTVIASLLVYQIFFQTKDLALVMSTNSSSINNRVDLVQKDINMLEQKIRQLESEVQRGAPITRIRQM